MKQDIRHRRLYAFYNSKVLNVLVLIGVIALLLCGYSDSMLLPVICFATSFTLFIGYALWIWIKKPQKITINNWVSNLTGCFTLYYLIAIRFPNLAWWWFAAPIIAAIAICFFDMVRPHDETFVI